MIQLSTMTSLTAVKSIEDLCDNRIYRKFAPGVSSLGCDG